MSHGNRDSGCGAVAAVLLALILGLVVLLLLGVFTFRSAERKQAVIALEAANVAAQQAQEVEAVLAQDQDVVDGESDPVTAVTIKLDADGIISFDGSLIDLDGLRLELTADRSSFFVLQADAQCQFQHVSNVLSAFDEVGVPRPALTLLEK